MMHQIIRARRGEQSAVTYIASLDHAIDFAYWLMEQGYAVDVQEGIPAAHPRTPREAEEADALTSAYASTLACPTRP